MWQYPLKNHKYSSRHHFHYSQVHWRSSFTCQRSLMAYMTRYCHIGTQRGEVPMQVRTRWPGTKRGVGRVGPTRMKIWSSMGLITSAGQKEYPFKKFTIFWVLQKNLYNKMNYLIFLFLYMRFFSLFSSLSLWSYSNCRNAKLLNWSGMGRLPYMLCFNLRGSSAANSACILYSFRALFAEQCYLQRSQENHSRWEEVGQWSSLAGNAGRKGGIWVWPFSAVSL